MTQQVDGAMVQRALDAQAAAVTRYTREVGVNDDRVNHLTAADMIRAAVEGYVLIPVGSMGSMIGKLNDGKLVIVGDEGEFDPEENYAPRLAIGLLGEQVRDRWTCGHCEQPGGVVFVENYDGQGNGSTFALCRNCIGQALTRQAIVTRLANFMRACEANVALVYKRRPEGDEYAFMSEYGQEAEDSPMAGGAIYGMQDDLAASIDQALKDARF